MKKFLISGVFSLMLAAAFSMPAFAEELIVGGQAVGIQISTEGVLVAGLSDVETEDGTASPAKDAGVKQGDLIIKIDGNCVHDSATVIAAVEGAEAGPVSLRLKKLQSMKHSSARTHTGKLSPFFRAALPQSVSLICHVGADKKRVIFVHLNRFLLVEKSRYCVVFPK